MLRSLLLHPFYRRFLLQGVAASIDHEPFLSSESAATVIDVGASRGQFALVARRCFPQATILAFEPVAPARAALAKIFSSDPNLEIFPFALGSGTGTGTLHLSRHEPSSSLLPIGAWQTRVFQGTGEVAVETVQVRRLEECLKDRSLKPPVICKIDVQGAESQVLDGFGGLAGRVDVLMVETSFVEFYEGQALFPDVLRRVGAMGFALEAVYGAVTDRNGSVLQCNCLFRRGKAAIP